MKSDSFTRSYIERKVQHLRAYGIAGSVARAAIQTRVEEVTRGDPRSRPKRVADALTEWSDAK